MELCLQFMCCSIVPRVARGRLCCLIHYMDDPKVKNFVFKKFLQLVLHNSKVPEGTLWELVN